MHESDSTENAKIAFSSTAPEQTQTTAQDGWDMLASGDVHEARRVFMRAADDAAADGLPQVGFALASAKLERWTEALLAMRRAMRIDADALNKVPDDPIVVEAVQASLEHFNKALKQMPNDADALFMVAAMQFLTGEDASAFLTIETALEKGDKDESAANLKRLIRAALDEAAKQPLPTQAPTTLNPAPIPATSPIVSPTTEPAEKKDVPF